MVLIASLKISDKMSANAFIPAFLTFRSVKDDRDWREMISVNLGCRKVPGEGDGIVEIAVGGVGACGGR